jgi:hypothetical protein
MHPGDRYICRPGRRQIRLAERRCGGGSLGPCQVDPGKAGARIASRDVEGDTTQGWALGSLLRFLSILDPQQAFLPLGRAVAWADLGRLGRAGVLSRHRPTLRSLIPNIEEIGIAGCGNVGAAFPSYTIQR